MKIDLPVNDRNANLLGEILRELFFDQTQGYGCYSTFDLNPSVEVLPNRPDPDDKFILWKRATLNVDGILVLMEYYWDGDGNLEFSWQENGKSILLVNGDCKKDYRWEFRSE